MYKIVLKGVVQGVGCRYFCAQTAKKMALPGRVTNMMDGSVEVLIDSADSSKIDEYVHNLRINKFGFRFFGSIQSADISSFDGKFIGDYCF